MSAALLFLFLLLLQRVSHAYPNSLYSRAATVVADINNFRGAILVKNGQPTTCELALIDNQSAFVAANCLDYNNGLINLNTKYEIYFDSAKGSAPGKATIQPNKIFVHSQYDMSTFANNIAVVAFDFADNGQWVNYLAVNALEWKSLVHVRRQLLDSKSMLWNTPSTTQSPVQPDSGCARASALFSANSNDMLCSKLALKTAKCSMPYGSIYGVASRAMAVSAIYSHTVVYAKDMCSGGSAFNYYTMLSNYTRFARAVLGRNSHQYIENQAQYLNLKHITNFRMASTAGKGNDKGAAMFGGDLSALQRNDLAQDSATSGTLLPPQAFSIITSTSTSSIAGASSTLQESASSGSSAPSSLAASPLSTAVGTGVSNDADADFSSQLSASDDDDDDSLQLISIADPGDLGLGAGTGGFIHTNIDDDIGSSNIESSASAGSTLQGKGPANDSSSIVVEGNSVPKSTVIALAVTIPIIVILASSGIFIMYRSHRKRRSGVFQPAPDVE